MNLRKQGLMARLQSPVEDDGEDTGGTDTVIEDEEVSEETVEETPEEVVVTIGEEKPPEEDQHAPDWVREVRKTNRELQRENRELKAKLTQPEKTVQLGKKPTLEDHEFDSDKYEQALESWYESKKKVEAKEAEQKKQQDEQAKAWQERLDSYGTAKTSLKVPDFEDAEDVAREVLSVTQQGIILQGATNPALVVYALGKNPDKAKELAAITDPVKFTFAVARLETQLKTAPKKPTFSPEKTVTGSGKISGVTGSTLEKLRSDAEKSGDYSKVIAYKKQKRA